MRFVGAFFIIINVKKFLFLLLIPFLLLPVSCSFLKSPQARAAEYFRLLYQLEFEKIKKLAKEPALLQAAYFQGYISEMNDAQKSAYAHPHITIGEIQKTSANEASVQITIQFPSGSSVQNTALMHRYHYIWYVQDLQNPIINETIYAY